MSLKVLPSIQISDYFWVDGPWSYGLLLFGYFCMCDLLSIHCIAKIEVLVHMLWNNLLKSSCCFWRSVAGIGY